MISQLEQRLTAQLRQKNIANAAEMAHDLLLKRGHIDSDGNLTEEGQKRQDLGASGRAIDRKVKESGGKHAKMDYAFDKLKNRALLKNVNRNGYLE